MFIFSLKYKTVGDSVRLKKSLAGEMVLWQRKRATLAEGLSLVPNSNKVAHSPCNYIQPPRGPAFTRIPPDTQHIHN